MTYPHVTRVFDLRDVNRDFVDIWMPRAVRHMGRPVTVTFSEDHRAVEATSDGVYLWTCTCGAAGVQASWTMVRSAGFFHRMVSK